MLSASNQSDSTGIGQGANSLQQPRTDLQQPTAQTGESSSPQTTPVLSQDQLNTESLRVGNSNQTVQNTTSAVPTLYYHHNYLNAAWLWLLVPLVLAALMFWPQKKAPAVAPSDKIERNDPKEQPAKSSPKSSEPATSPKKPKKNQSKNKRRKK